VDQKTPADAISPDAFFDIKDPNDKRDKSS
jgi:hypothetical protein